MVCRNIKRSCSQELNVYQLSWSRCRCNFVHKEQGSGCVFRFQNRFPRSLTRPFKITLCFLFPKSSFFPYFLPIPASLRALLQHMERDVVLLAMGGFDHVRNGALTRPGGESCCWSVAVASCGTNRARGADNCAHAPAKNHTKHHHDITVYVAGGCIAASLRKERIAQTKGGLR